ncbi:HAD family phosphatase [Hoeflea sp.]|uniref:HAD family hydrolase n=1 Tax=Hoeflea sp. TaxID=1940281 RepID=UPI0019908EA4|nr:HAD family phosphatase [Hoeflea sp.]MBC7282220.1 HAD family phosphatase [Hoeflea sp.]
MSASRAYQAVFFDMDGLLLDTEQLSFKSYRRTREALGLPPDDELFMSLIGLNQHAGMARLVEGMAGYGNASAFSARWDEEYARHLGEGIPVKPGVTAVLDCLRSAAIPYAIVTSTRTEKALSHLHKAGLAGLFEVVVGGDQVVNGKPAPDIYLRAAGCLGVDPESCVAFEDSENGVRAAVAAGMVTVQIPDLKHPTADFLRLGHSVAPDLMAGAALVGLPLVETLFQTQ